MKGSSEGARLGKRKTMSRTTIPLKLSEGVMREAARLAKEDGVSPDQWSGSAVAQKIGAVQTAAQFLKDRAGNTTGEGLLEILRRVPSRGIELGDEF
jgi:hypothetical protein